MSAFGSLASRVPIHNNLVFDMKLLQVTVSMTLNPNRSGRYGLVWRANYHFLTKVTVPVPLALFPHMKSFLHQPDTWSIHYLDTCIFYSRPEKWRTFRQVVRILRTFKSISDFFLITFRKKSCTSFPFLWLFYSQKCAGH